MSCQQKTRSEPQGTEINLKNNNKKNRPNEPLFMLLAAINQFHKNTPQRLHLLFSWCKTDRKMQDKNPQIINSFLQSHWEKKSQTKWLDVKRRFLIQFQNEQMEKAPRDTKWVLYSASVSRDTKNIVIMLFKLGSVISF